MKLIITKHFLERCKERYSQKDIAYIKYTFEYAMKLVKRKKLHTRRPKIEESAVGGVEVLRFEDMKFVFRKVGGEYILITFCKRTF